MDFIENLKKLRQETQVSIMECQKALEEAKGDINLAKKILRRWGRDFAKKQLERKVKEGLIASYIHSNRKIGVLLELNCESDFVARSKEFQELSHELCLQIAAINPKEFPLLKQPWIRDEKKKVKDLIADYISKLGENIVVKRFERYEI